MGTGAGAGVPREGPGQAQGPRRKSGEAGARTQHSEAVARDKTAPPRQPGQQVMGEGCASSLSLWAAFRPLHGWRWGRCWDPSWGSPLPPRGALNLYGLAPLREPWSVTGQPGRGEQTGAEGRTGGTQSPQGAESPRQPDPALSWPLWGR